MTDTTTVPTNTEVDELLVVQFCPCGCVYNMRRSKVVKLIGTKQLDLIESGRKLDAPILPSSLCEDCMDERDRQDRLNEEMDLGLFERTFD